MINSLLIAILKGLIMIKKSDPCVIVTHVSGSRAYGTEQEDSDLDIRGIFAAEDKFYRTPFFNLNEVVIESDEDTKLYELNRFMALCVRQSPNILETLWVDEKSIITSSPEYNFLRKNRGLFSTKQMADRFVGFAMEHMQKINTYGETHDKNPPRQADFISFVRGFTDTGKSHFDINAFANDHAMIHFGNDIYGVYKAPGTKAITKDGVINKLSKERSSDFQGIPDFMVKYNRSEYEKKRAAWSGFWSRTRSSESTRGLLERKFGYDTKDGMHLVRILRMGVEFMETGRFNVRRPDAAELLEIREHGILSKEELEQYTSIMTEKIMNLKATSRLPDEVDIERVANLTIALQDMNKKRVNIEKNKSGPSL